MSKKIFSHEFEIRLAKPEDLPRLQYFNTPYRTSDLNRYMENSNCFILVFEGIARGLALINDHFFNSLMVEYIFIQSEYRNLGLGSQFLNYFVKHCASEKAFACIDENHTLVKNILSSKGFVQSGYLYNIGPSPLILFAKKVRGSAEIKDCKEEIEYHKKILKGELVNILQNRVNAPASLPGRSGFRW